MNNWVLEEAQVALSDAGYSTLLLQEQDRFAFEDDEVLGFCVVYDSIDTLLRGWQEDETALLSRFAAVLRRSGRKAWNVYFVCLTIGLVDDQQKYLLDKLDANLFHTRKIARANLNVPADVRAALAPLLPLQNDPQLASERFEERLEVKLRSEVGQEVADAILGSADEITVARAITDIVE